MKRLLVVVVAVVAMFAVNVGSASAARAPAPPGPPGITFGNGAFVIHCQPGAIAFNRGGAHVGGCELT